MLVLQIIVKQWDKSQRTATHVLERANIPDRHPIIFPPAFYAANKHCVIDWHGDDRQGGRLKYTSLADGKIQFDRFQLNLDDKVIGYSGRTQSDKTPSVIGSLDNQWVQCRYTDRHSVFDSDFYYWLYEEVTLNAICLREFNDKIFMDTEPALVFEDFQ